MSQAPQGDRKALRRRVLKAGVICYNGRHTTLPCAVRDFTEAGVRLRVEGSIGVPDTFELLIELDGMIVPCAVVWRSKTEVGAKFTGPIEYAAPKRMQVLAPTLGSKPNKPSLRRK